MSFDVDMEPDDDADELRLESRVTVALDQRQVFFVLMGVLVLASGILVLGYVIGRRAAPVGVSAQAGLSRGRSNNGAVALTYPERLMEPSPSPQPVAEASAVTAKVRRKSDADNHAKAAADQAESAMADREADERAGKAQAETGTAAAAAGSGPLPRDRRPKTPKATKAEEPAKSGEPAKPPGKPPEQQKVDALAAEALAALAKLRRLPALDKTLPREIVAASAPERPRRFTVQASAFKLRTDAMVLVARLRSRGHAPYLVLSDVPGRGRWYRVRVGRFDSRQAAQRYKDNFDRREKLTTFITDM